MKLSTLKDLISSWVNRAQHGKRLKAKKVQKVLEQLEKKSRKYKRAISSADADKTKAKLASRLKVVKAQISKAQKLLKQLEA